MHSNNNANINVHKNNVQKYVQNQQRMSQAHNYSNSYSFSYQNSPQKLSCQLTHNNTNIKSNNQNQPQAADKSHTTQNQGQILKKIEDDTTFSIQYSHVHSHANSQSQTQSLSKNNHQVMQNCSLNFGNQVISFKNSLVSSKCKDMDQKGSNQDSKIKYQSLNSSFTKNLDNNNNNTQRKSIPQKPQTNPLSQKPNQQQSKYHKYDPYPQTSTARKSNQYRQLEDSMNKNQINISSLILNEQQLRKKIIRLNKNKQKIQSNLNLSISMGQPQNSDVSYPTNCNLANKDSNRIYSELPTQSDNPNIKKYSTLTSNNHPKQQNPSLTHPNTNSNPKIKKSKYQKSQQYLLIDDHSNVIKTRNTLQGCQNNRIMPAPTQRPYLSNAYSNNSKYHQNSNEIASTRTYNSHSQAINLNILTTTKNQHINKRLNHNYLYNKNQLNNSYTNTNNPNNPNNNNNNTPLTNVPTHINNNSNAHNITNMYMHKSIPVRYQKYVPYQSGGNAYRSGNGDYQSSNSKSNHGNGHSISYNIKNYMSLSANDNLVGNGYGNDKEKEFTVSQFSNNANNNNNTTNRHDPPKQPSRTPLICNIPNYSSLCDTNSKNQIELQLTRQKQIETIREKYRSRQPQHKTTENQYQRNHQKQSKQKQRAVNVNKINNTTFRFCQTPFKSVSNDQQICQNKQLTDFNNLGINNKNIEGVTSLNTEKYKDKDSNASSFTNYNYNYNNYKRQNPNAGKIKYLSQSFQVRPDPKSQNRSIQQYSNKKEPINTTTITAKTKQIKQNQNKLYCYSNSIAILNKNGKVAKNQQSVPKESIAINKTNTWLTINNIKNQQVPLQAFDQTFSLDKFQKIQKSFRDFGYGKNKSSYMHGLNGNSLSCNKDKQFKQKQIKLSSNIKNKSEKDKQSSAYNNLLENYQENSYKKVHNINYYENDGVSKGVVFNKLL